MISCRTDHPATAVDGLHCQSHGTFVPLNEAVIGAIADYLTVVGILDFKLVTGKEGMDYGDFKLLAALGA